MKDSRLDDIFKKSSETDREIPFSEHQWSKLESKLDKGHSPFPSTLQWLLPIMLSAVILAFAKYQWNAKESNYQNEIQQLQQTIDQYSTASAKYPDTVFIKEAIVTNDTIVKWKTNETTTAPLATISEYGNYLATIGSSISSTKGSSSINKQTFNWKNVIGYIQDFTANENLAATNETSTPSTFTFAQKVIPFLHQGASTSLGQKILTEKEKKVLANTPRAVDYHPSTLIRIPPYRLHNFYLDDDFESIASGHIDENAIIAEWHRQRFKPKPKYEIGFTFGAASSEIIKTNNLLTLEDLGNPVLKFGTFRNPNNGEEFTLFTHPEFVNQIPQRKEFLFYRLHLAKRVGDYIWFKGGLLYHHGQLNRKLSVNDLPNNSSFTSYDYISEKVVSAEFGMRWNFYPHKRFTPYVGLTGIFNIYRHSQVINNIGSFAYDINMTVRQTLNQKGIKIRPNNVMAEAGIKYQVLPQLEIGIETFFFGRFRNPETPLPGIGLRAHYKL